MLEIPNTDERNTYMKAITYGTEYREYVRIHVVGKDGVGKTSLIHRLLGYEQHDGVSTDGIEINRKCQIRKKDGEWIVGKGELDFLIPSRKLALQFFFLFDIFRLCYKSDSNENQIGVEHLSFNMNKYFLFL